LHEFRFIALGVSILDAQDHRAALVTSEKPIKQSGTRASHVEIACR
jgi:hypothetical protein